MHGLVPFGRPSVPEGIIDTTGSLVSGTSPSNHWGFGKDVVYRVELSQGDFAETAPGRGIEDNWFGELAHAGADLYRPFELPPMEKRTAYFVTTLYKILYDQFMQAGLDEEHALCLALCIATGFFYLGYMSGPEAEVRRRVFLGSVNLVSGVLNRVHEAPEGTVEVRQHGDHRVFVTGKPYLVMAWWEDVISAIVFEHYRALVGGPLSDASKKFVELQREKGALQFYHTPQTRDRLEERMKAYADARRDKLPSRLKLPNWDGPPPAFCSAPAQALPASKSSKRRILAAIGR